MTFQDKIKAIALATNAEEFTQWLHSQVVDVAEYIETLGIEDPYEKAKSYVFKTMQEATN